MTDHNGILRPSRQLARLHAARPVGALLLALGLAACDNQSPSRAALQKSTMTAEAVGLAAASAEDSSKGLQQATSSLTSDTQAGTEGEKNSSALLVAQAALASGESAATQAQGYDEEVRRQLSTLVETSSQWAQSNAVAQSAQAFDPTKQIEQLSKQMQERDTQIGEARTRKEALAKQHEDLASRAQGLIDQGTAMVRQASQLSQRATGVSAREGVALVEQAAQMRREGEGLRLQGERLSAEAGQVAPQVTEAEALIRQYQNQKTSLGQAQDALRARKVSFERDVSDARNHATLAAQGIDATYAQASKLLQDDFLPASDRALSEFSKAAGTARKVQSSTPAKLAVGNAQISAATVQIARMKLMDAYAGTLEVLARCEPALVRRGEFANKASDLRTKQKEAMEAAKTALDDAKGAYASSNVRGAEQERLAKVGEQIDALSKNLEGVAASVAPAGSMDKGASADSTSGAKVLVESAIAAAKEGRWDDLKGMYLVKTDAGKQMLDASLRASAAGQRIDKAFQSKFQTSFDAAIKASPMAPMLGMMSQLSKGDLSKLDPASVTYTPSDTGVSVDMGLPVKVEAVQADGAWKFSGKMLDESAAAMAGQVAMLDGLIQAQEGFAGKVEAGEFSDANAAVAGFVQLLQQKMMGGMGGGG